jgi:hypothetical protein
MRSLLLPLPLYPCQSISASEHGSLWVHTVGLSLSLTQKGIECKRALETNHAVLPQHLYLWAADVYPVDVTPSNTRLSVVGALAKHCSSFPQKNALF